MNVVYEVQNDEIFTSSDSRGGGKNENEILLDLKLNFLIIDSVDELVDYFPSLVSFLKNFFILHMRKILFTYVVASKFWLSFGVYISTRSHVKGFFFT